MVVGWGWAGGAAAAVGTPVVAAEAACAAVLLATAAAKLMEGAVPEAVPAASEAAAMLANELVGIGEAAPGDLAAGGCGRAEVALLPAAGPPPK